MRILLVYASLFFLLFNLSCQINDDDIFAIFNTYKSDGNEIDIGSYRFQFPRDFSLVQDQGVDSYVGRIISPEITLHFDYGGYTKPQKDLPISQYITIEGETKGHFKQIVKPIDQKMGRTAIHLYNKNKIIGNPDSNNSLTVSTTDLTIEEQELVLSIFNSVIPLQ